MKQLKLSKKAIQALIIEPEVSTRKTYDLKYQRPVWPGGNSGVTIGLGYDLGHVSKQELATDLSGLMTKENIAALSVACGVTGVRSKSLVSKLKHIVFLWEPACELFYKRSLPKHAVIAARAYDELETIHPYEQTAIVGIVYNRGADTRDTERRREMNLLKQAIKDDNDVLMAGLIKQMKRLWDVNKQGGLHKRRDLEAQFVALPDVAIPDDDILIVSIN